MKLSDLEKGKSYRIKADRTDVQFVVVKSGPMPIVSFVNDSREGDAPFLRQLLGWIGKPANSAGFLTDSRPEQDECFLLILRHFQGVPGAKVIDGSPLIELVE